MLDATTVDHDLILDLYKRMLFLRMAETALAREYRKQEMRTPTHFGLGQEAVAVGVCAVLNRDDVVYSHHRCHNHYLAKGGSLKALAAELYGREDGCSKGRGGSVHLTGRDTGFIVSSAILGQCIPVAVGSALAFQMDHLARVAVVFFGEAACEEGVFYESLNYASIHKLPVLFVCENNLYSTESPLSTRQPADTSLCDRARSFKIKAEQVDGNDAMAVHQAAEWWIDRCRQGHGPAFLECMTYRHLEHVGPNYDHEMGRKYRSKEEFMAWFMADPVRRAADITGLSWDELQELGRETSAVVEAEIAAAKLSPWPTDLMANA